MVEFSLDETNQAIANFLEKQVGSKFRIFQLAGDASTRRYFRIVVDKTSYVLMVWEPFVDNQDYPFLSVLNCLHENDISVPQVLGKSPEDGLILLEDLGDLTLERKFWESQDQDLALPYYKQSLDQLLKIHLLHQQDHAKPCTALTTSFDVDKFMWEFRYSMKHFIRSFCNIEVSDKVEKEISALFQDICERLLAPQKVVCHRDFHSRNVMIQLGHVKIIDFQDARLGPVQYDLVSILKDSYVDLSSKHQSLLLNSYFDKFSKASNDEVSRDQFFENYELQTIQRCFKVCGSFASFYNDRQDTRYLKHIEGTVQTVRKSLSQFPEYSVFMNFLSDNKIFQRTFEAP